MCRALHRTSAPARGRSSAEVSAPSSGTTSDRHWPRRRAHGSEGSRTEVDNLVTPDPEPRREHAPRVPERRDLRGDGAGRRMVHRRRGRAPGKLRRRSLPCRPTRSSRSAATAGARQWSSRSCSCPRHRRRRTADSSRSTPTRATRRQRAGTPTPSCSQTLRRNGVDDVVQVVRARSVDVELPPRIALVFLDGLHDEDSVRADIAHVEPHIPPGGLLALHDYRPDYPGVVAAADPHAPRWAVRRGRFRRVVARASPGIGSCAPRVSDRVADARQAADRRLEIPRSPVILRVALPGCA